MSDQKYKHEAAIEYEKVTEDYLEQRKLKRFAGPLLLWGLGVGYVISGDYFGWNFGLAAGGFGGLFIATILMAIMYTAMCFTLCELSTMIPFTGGPYAFARKAMGPWGGYLCGIGVLLEYIFAPAVIANGIAGYITFMFPTVPKAAIVIGVYILFVLLNSLGAKTTLTFELGITTVAVIGLLIFAGGAFPHFDVSKLFEIAPKDGTSAFLPMGLLGIWAAIPYAIWLFLAVEGLPLASEETNDPVKDMPKGIISSILTLLVTAAIVLVLGAGTGGAKMMGEVDSPLPSALGAVYGETSWLPQALSLIGLAGLIASFNSIIYAYGRMMFALSRAGYLPKFLSITSRRFHTPYVATIAGAIIGAITAVFQTGDVIIQVSVFGANISYIMMMLAAIVLRMREPNLPRPYKTPGYPVTTYAALILACIALVAGLFYMPEVVIVAAIIYAIFVLYFALYSRHHLVAKAPEEEFALMAAAEAELDKA